MEMADLSDIKGVFELFRTMFGTFREAKDLIPDQSQREAVAKSIDEAERASQIAEAQIAQALGYPLHRCVWPPQIMLFDHQDSRGRNKHKCPGCGFVEKDSPPPPRRHYGPGGPGGWMAI